MIPFNVVIPKDQQDPELGNKLKRDRDASLTWAVEGLADYLAIGLGEPSTVVTATQNYADSQDDVRRFIAARCIEDPTAGDTTSALHDTYEAWAAEEGIHQAHRLGRTKFGAALDKLGYTASRMKAGAVRLGLVIDQTAA